MGRFCLRVCGSILSGSKRGEGWEGADCTAPWQSSKSFLCFSIAVISLQVQGRRREGWQLLASALPHGVKYAEAGETKAKAAHSKFSHLFHICVCVSVCVFFLAVQRVASRCAWHVAHVTCLCSRTLRCTS